MTKDLTRMKHIGKYDPYVVKNPYLLRELESVTVESSTDIFGAIKTLMNNMPIIQQVIALYNFNSML
jgi:hypothetical protein